MNIAYRSLSFKLTTSYLNKAQIEIVKFIPRPRYMCYYIKVYKFYDIRRLTWKRKYWPQ